jgi:DNA-directed RNA polymerase specialized sigma24 family protein
LRLLKLHACSALGPGEEELIDAAEAKRAAIAELREQLDVWLVKASQGNEENLALLRARYLQGLSIAELAQQFDLTEKAVECRLRRMRKNMPELPE